ncbi:THAP domain-containing protein 1 [Nymphon striatum]|nr:THAP domain-containing protein 1 [Nymphon striatum]
MGYKCVAFGCKSGYNKSETSKEVTFHKFPLNNSQLLRKWTTKICREKYTPTRHSKVCSLHFSPTSFIKYKEDSNIYRTKSSNSKLQYRRLKPDAVPSIFQNVHGYLSTAGTAYRSTSATAEKRIEKENDTLEAAIKNMWNGDGVTTLSALIDKLKTDETVPSGHTLHLESNGETLAILFIKILNGIPVIIASITLDTQFQVCVRSQDKVVNVKKYIHLLTVESRVLQYSEILNLMAFCKSAFIPPVDDPGNFDEKETIMNAVVDLQKCAIATTDDFKQKSLTFIAEQLELLLCKTKSARRYSPSCIIFSYLLYSVSANAYRNLLNHQILCLPSISTLQKVTNKTRRFSTNEYLTIRSKELNSQQQNVILMVDEIYTSERMEYSSATGKIFGLTTESQLCGTLLCFMICSLNCPYKDVVSLIPINVITAKKLEVHCNGVLKLLDNIGFNVVLICMDNHPVNRSYITKILCEGNLKPQVKNPINGNPLFVLFDPVHNFKNVYNNFQSKKIFKYPDFNSIDSIPINTASFHDLIDLCNIESDKPMRMAHKLTTTCLNPISIEKTSVKLACAIFHESTRDALKFFTSQMNKPWEGTHKFVSLILKLWNIINVKSTTKGYHKCNIQQDPLLSINDWKLNFISDFSKFLEIWHSNGAKHGLSKETFTALHHMCLTLPALAKYAFEELGFQYVLLGMFQSDPIESRFGWYRQLSGANYYVSAKQVIESEEKIKAISLMKFTNFDLNSVSNSIEEIISSDDIQLIEDALNEISDSYHCQINHNDVNIIYYVAGAIIKTELRQSRCEDCKKILVDSSTNLHSMNFDQFDKIDQSVKQFVAQSSNHNTFFNKVVFSFTEISAIEHNNLCPNGHKFVNNIVNRFFNCCMKKFVKDISNELICKKKKITKLSSEWLKEMFKIFSKGSRFNQIKKKSAFAMLKICLYDTSLAYCRILLVQASSPEVRERGGACIQTSMDDVKNWSRTGNLGNAKRKAEDNSLWYSIVVNLRIEDDT